MTIQDSINNFNQSIRKIAERDLQLAQQMQMKSHLTKDSTTAMVMNTITKKPNNMDTTKMITGKQTLVLTIEELYRTIPNTKQLEGYNFRDLKELLVKLIKEIEATGEWEFVQYINNKPSYFVVRQLLVKEVASYVAKDINPYEEKPASKKSDKKAEKQYVTQSEPVHVADQPVPSPSITFTKLPWES